MANIETEAGKGPHRIERSKKTETKEQKKKKRRDKHKKKKEASLDTSLAREQPHNCSSRQQHVTMIKTEKGKLFSALLVTRQCNKHEHKNESRTRRGAKGKKKK